MNLLHHCTGKKKTVCIKLGLKKKNVKVCEKLPNCPHRHELIIGLFFFLKTFLVSAPTQTVVSIVC